MEDTRVRIGFRIAASLAATVLLAVLALLAAFLSFRQLEEVSRERQHIYQVIDFAEDLLSALQDSETSQRGYMLTGNPVFLLPYTAVRDDVAGHLEKLRQAVPAPASASGTHLSALTPLVAAKLAEMAKVISLYNKGEVAAAIALVSGGQGRLLMDSIRGELKSFMRIEHASLAQHEAQVLLYTRNFFMIIVAAILIATLFAFAAVHFAFLETKQRFGKELLLKTQNLLQTQQELNQAIQQTNRSLTVSEEKLRLFADNIPIMTTFWDIDLRCRFANKMFVEFFGGVGDSLIGKHLQELAGGEAYSEVHGHFAQALQGFPVNYQRTRVLDSGEVRYLAVKLLPQFGELGSILGCFAVMTDISEHKLDEQRIQQVAHHDSLTGLPNRLLLNDRLAQAINLAKRDSRQFALLFLDLDKFKPVNDVLGHAAGDELLQAVASRILCQVRASDTVARVGGDEFVVILHDIDGRTGSETVAQKIVSAIGAPFQLGCQEQGVEIGCSIGVAIYPSDAHDADALVKAADEAMYSAKRKGGSYCFCPALCATAH